MDFREQLRALQDDLLSQVRRPNIYAYQPHGKQVTFHSSTKNERLFIGGNRSGKTVAGAAEMIYYLKGEHPYKAVKPAPTRNRSVSMDFTSGVNMIVKPEIQRWIPPSLLINGSWEDSYNNNDRLLTCANGSFLEFKSYDQELLKFAGTSRDSTWFDEEPPEDVFEECYLRLLDCDGDYWITMTPLPEYGGGLTWVYDRLYLPGKQGTKDIEIIEVNTDENPTLDPKVIKRMFDTMTPEQAAARRRGEFIQIGGLVFPKFNPEMHVVDRMIYDIKNPRIRLMASMDYGLNDPTAWLWHLVHDNGTVFTFKEHYQNGLTIKQHAAIVHNIEAEFGRRPDLRVGDPSIAQRNGQTGLSNHTAYAQTGLFIALAKGSRDINPGIQKMMEYLYWDEKVRPKWFIHESCHNLIREMRKWKWKTKDSKKAQDKVNKGETPVDKDNHAIDSARYLFSFMPELRNPKSLDASKLNAFREAGQMLNPSVPFNAVLGHKDENVLRPATQWHDFDPMLGDLS